MAPKLRERLEGFRALVDLSKEDPLDPTLIGHIDIYQLAYGQRLISYLKACFPGLGALIQPTRLDDLLAAYLQAYPPRGHTMFDLGEALPAFLKATLSNPDRDLVDLAKFEWMMEKTTFLDADGDEILETDASVLLHRPDLYTVAFIPSLSILLSEWPLHLMYENAQRAAEPAQQPYMYAIYKADIEVHYQRVSDPLAGFLVWLLETEDLMGATKKFGEDARRCLQDCQDRGWILGVKRRKLPQT